jgi:hypothetical protein
MVCFKILGRLRNDMNNLNHCSRSSGRDSKLELPEIERRMLNNTRRRVVRNQMGSWPI